jgi:hypothetical protein
MICWRRLIGILCMVGLAAALVACERDPRYPSTVAMAQRLAEIAASVDPLENSYLSVGRAEGLRRQVQPEDGGQKLAHRLRLAKELLQAGETVEALGLFRQAREQAAGFRLRTRPSLEELLALAYMRLGEQENCIGLYNPAACLLPFGPAGVHQDQTGSRQAAALYEQILAKTPDDRISRWLLNIAYMTLGEYPEAVPKRWLIPPASFAAEYEIGHFPDIAAQVGVAAMSLAGGAIMEDFDGDGFLDLMASSWGMDHPLRYFRNRGDGSFEDLSIAAGLEGLVGGLNIVQTDYDNDGYPDVYVMRGGWFGAAGQHPNSLLRNDGAGRFEDVTERSGLLSLHPTQTAAWGDFDNDGWLDLFVGNEASRQHPHPCELYRNNGDGTFTEVAAGVGAQISGYVKGVTWGDYDNDGRLDLYISRLSAANVLLHNEGPDAEGKWRFTDATAFAGVGEPVTSFPTWFWDYDNDGWLDIFVSGYRADAGDVAAEYLGLPFKAERPRLYRNNGDGTFADVTVGAGLDRVIYTMGCNFGDLDNDGYSDFFAATGDPDLRSLIPNRVFRNDGGTVFQDVSASGGFGQLQKGHGVAFGDIDNDGDQDIYTVVGGAYAGDVYHNALYLNPGHGNHWLNLSLAGSDANRAAIGARIRVGVDTPQGQRAVHAVVGTGASFGASSLQAEIGLGDAIAVLEVQVVWPASGLVQRFSGLELDRTYRLSEGTDTPVLLKRPALKWNP